MAVSVLDKKLQFPPSITPKIDVEAYKSFIEKLCNVDYKRFSVFTFPFDCSDALPFLKNLDSQSEFLFYSEKPTQHKTITAGGSLTEITAKGSDRFHTVEEQIEDIKKKTTHFNHTLTENGLCFLGGFSFFDHIASPEWEGFKSASFTLPKRMIVKSGDSGTISIAIRLQSNSTPDKIHRQLRTELENLRLESDINTTTHNSRLAKAPVTDYAEWKHAIAEAKQRINEYKFSKVVLARQLSVYSSNKFDPTAILNRLRSNYPNCRTYLIRRKNSAAFIGSTPERILSFDGNHYQTEALAGSMPRGGNSMEDQQLEKRLYNSYKNRIEHDLVINHIKDTIEYNNEIFDSHTEPVITKLANIQHLHTPIQFKTNLSPLQVLKKLHPTPALGGYPQKKVLSYLQKNCLIDRGWFGAPIGWINSENRGEFAVAIRGGLVNQNRAKLFAGCGIVAHSDPKNEWEESELKFKPMLSALQHDAE